MLNHQRSPKNRIINQFIQLQKDSYDQKQHETWKSLNDKRIKAKNRFIHIDQDFSYLQFSPSQSIPFQDASDTKLNKMCSASTRFSQKQPESEHCAQTQSYFTPKKHINSYQQPSSSQVLLNNELKLFYSPKVSDGSIFLESQIQQTKTKLKRYHTQPYQTNKKQLSLEQILQNSQRLQFSQDKSQIFMQNFNFQDQHSIPLFSHSFNTQILSNDKSKLQLIDYNNYCYVCDQFANLSEIIHVCKHKIVNFSEVQSCLQQIMNMAEAVDLMEYKKFAQIINQNKNYSELRSLYDFFKIRTQSKEGKQKKSKIEQIILMRLINITGKKMGLVLIS